MCELALIGPTACGKSALAIKLAEKFNAEILSLDSLSIYKEIDIASAKPSKAELSQVKHHGIDEIYPDEHFSAALFLSLYKRVKSELLKQNRPLIIVGGTSFYLKMLVDGVSELPKTGEESAKKAKEAVRDLSTAYALLKSIDEVYAMQLSQNDSYRISKALELFFETGMPPSELYGKSEKIAANSELKIFEIVHEPDLLRQKIHLRTELMLRSGLIDEVAGLEKKYSVAPKCMSTIGIKEVLLYFNGRVAKKDLCSLIGVHTAQLAKRQRTFNRTQFKEVFKAELPAIEVEIESFLGS